MSGGKIIPIVAAGDQAVREDVVRALEATVRAAKTQLDAAVNPLMHSIATLNARVDRLEQQRKGRAD
jgi:TATA-binding protein-associated factor Taf7